MLGKSFNHAKQHSENSCVSVSSMSDLFGSSLVWMDEKKPSYQRALKICDSLERFGSSFKDVFAFAEANTVGKNCTLEEPDLDAMEYFPESDLLTIIVRRKGFLAAEDNPLAHKKVKPS